MDGFSTAAWSGVSTMISVDSLRGGRNLVWGCWQWLWCYGVEAVTVVAALTMVWVLTADCGALVALSAVVAAGGTWWGVVRYWPSGAPVTEERQPHLFAAVRSTADVLGVRLPDAIWLVGDTGLPHSACLICWRTRS